MTAPLLLIQPDGASPVVERLEWRTDFPAPALDGTENRVYAQGRTEPGAMVTNAGPGQSRHNAVDAAGKPASTAFDIAIKHPNGSLNWDARSKAWATAGAIGMAMGLDWGGSWTRFKDAPHFQLKA